MQGAIACICHKNHDDIPTTSAFFYFGERTEEGNPIDRRGEEAHSFCRTYFTEREHSSVRLENMLRKQISIMDSFRKLCSDVNVRLQQEEAVILWLDGKKTVLKEKIKVLEERLKVLEEPQKLEKELLCKNNWALVQEKTLLLQYENLMKSKEEKDQLKEDNNALKMENEELKKKIAEMEAAPLADEDPEEVTLYNTDGER
jgi:hypothetical protein